MNIAKPLPIKLPKKLADVSIYKTYEKREVILRPEDQLEHFCIIESGHVKIYEDDDKGSYFVQAIMGPGDFFSMLAPGNKPLATMFYQAIDEVKVKCIPRIELIEASKNDATLCFNILQQTNRQMLFYRMRFDNLMYKLARERIAYRLLLLAYRFGERHNSYIVLPDIVQEDLAQIISLSRESVSKGLARLQRRGSVSTVDGKIAIHDIQALIDEMPKHKKLPAFFHELQIMH